MDSSNLFSHPQEPEYVSPGDTSTGPVENPTFSDRPETSVPGTTSPSP
jgi:hypothetical protein